MLLEMRIVLLFALAAWLQAADDPFAAEVFAQHCASCHQSEAGASGRIPQIDALRKMTSAAIQKTLESGIMKTQAAPLSADERSKVASYLGITATQQKQRDQIANPCPANAEWKSGPSFASWGGDLSNTRFQSGAAAGFRAEDVPKLKLAWAFAFPDTSTLRSQPAIYRGRVFAGAQDGSVYALDAATGCVHWAASVESQVRSGMTVGEVNGAPVLFFGDSSGFLYALDATTGKQLWKMRAEDHPSATQTSTPVLYQGRLYIGSASREESLSITPSYLCCKFRGSETAIDAATGKIVWKRYTINEVAKERGKTRRGAKIYGPSGAGIWTAATLDPSHDSMYVVTGDNYSEPPTALSDALVALKMSTGEILWSKQFTAKDVYNSSCQVSDKVNCPDVEGPDYDFASPAILVTLANGKRALLLGQKSAVVFAVDPDRKGAALWRTRIGEGGIVGGIEWGSASDGRNIYVALSDIRYKVDRKPGSNDRVYQLDPDKGGGLFALRADNGERVWKTPPPGCNGRPACSPAQSAAITGIPGVVWSGAEDGHLRAYSTNDGKIVWDYDSAHEYKTVNGVPGHGGTIDVAGPIVADGMLFSVSGFPSRGGMSGNVLLAFRVEP